jgi:hypothetical protein
MDLKSDRRKPENLVDKINGRSWVWCSRNDIDYKGLAMDAFMSSSSENLPKMTSEVLIQKEIKCILGCTV